MITLHREIMIQKCNLCRELFEIQLAVGKNHPDEFAKLFMKKEGFTALKAGEVVHIVQCQVVEVTVLYNNQSMFMTPGIN